MSSLPPDPAHKAHDVVAVSRGRIVSWFQAAPLAIVLILFFGLPLAVVVVVSFWDYDLGGLVADFTLINFAELFTSGTTYALYARSIMYAGTVWLITVILGFTISYFLVFHVRNFLLTLALLLLCTIPFWTSVVIRTIAWIPFLGKNGLFNQLLVHMGLIDEPLEFLLFSNFAVVISYVHLFTLPMLVPIANAMFRIDPEVIEAARDAGANPFQVIAHVVIPLCKNGIVLGSILVVTFILGEFSTVRIMSGGKFASVVSAMSYEIGYVQYPPAAASAVVLMIIVVLMVSLVIRMVDVQKSLVE
jgi:putative spermidine/putrescine transport system permease protein